MDEKTKERIESMIKTNKVFLFMKGTPEEPACGFSLKVVHTLQEQSIPFAFFDVLEDDDIREGIKEYAQWPTIPQLYINGEFIGGCDIVTQLATKGELKTLLT